MTNPTPVAWMQGNIVGKMQFSAECSPLYTESQLRQAKADALREAFGKLEQMVLNGEASIAEVSVGAQFILAMVAEIEGEK